MFRWFLRRRLNAEEEKLGESMDYLRHIVDESPMTFLRFASVMPFVNSRKVLPAEAWFVGQIAGVKHEDCGPCLQITVNLARKSGVEGSILQAAIDGNTDALPTELADVYRFACSVVASQEDDDALRQSLRERYGERGLIELAYAIASSRIPPTIKRTLGYATSCKLVTVQVT